MDGSNPVVPDDLDRELAAVLRLQPSVEFQARVRARVGAEPMNTGWSWRAPAYAGCALVILAAAVWVSSRDAMPAAPILSNALQPAATMIPAPPIAPLVERPRPSRPVRRQWAVVRNEPVPPVAESRRTAEVLLSESERAGVRLLFESSASGRLELPENMLRDLSLPIVDVRASAVGGDWQASGGEGARQ